MEDYIERGALRKALSEADGITFDSLDVFDSLEIVDGIPSADVAPVVHGKWVNDIQCSNCGWYMEDDVTISPMMVFFDYCPHCGAKMDLVI